MKRHKGIEKLGPKKYRIRVRGTDPRTGERKEVKRIVHGPLEAAQAAQRQLAEELERGGPNTKVTLTDYSRLWLEAKAMRVKPSTARKYANDLSLHILPALGHYYVDALRPRDVATFIAE